MTKFLHFSDVHFSPPKIEMKLGAWANKRALGYANLMLNRARYFMQAEEKVRALVDVARNHKVDAILCTGDYAVLGTKSELEQAREIMRAFETLALPIYSLPGNHDYYLGDSEEHYVSLFADLEKEGWKGEFPLVDHMDDCVLIRLNSSRPNVSPFLSSGRISDDQITAFEKMTHEPWAKEKTVIIATHYGFRTELGMPDKAKHALENAERVLEISSRFRRGIICHGHIHHCYQVTTPATPLLLSCAGSATMKGREGAWVYDVEDHQIQSTHLKWSEGGWKNK